MEGLSYVLKKIATLAKVGIYYTEEEDLQSFAQNTEGNPIWGSVKLRELLQKGADQQEEPYIYQDEYTVYFACLKKSKDYFFVGPMSLKLLSRLELHQFYQHYGIKGNEEKRLGYFTFSKVIDIVELLATQIIQREYSYEEIVKANHLTREVTEKIEQEQVIFDFQEGEEELYHHTYQEERKLLECVRQGQVEDALLHSRNMDVDLGKLSTKEMNHWKNVAVVAITLCTRAAVEGGLSPSVAYRLSDFYIQKSDSSNDIAQILECRNQAVRDLTSRVQQKMTNKSTSNYVERCKDYVEKHYREKIYQDEIAEVLHISPSYLSRLFHREEGMRLQDYIVKVRLDHATNLLLYSDESVAKIAEYVNFPSQSYFGKVFKIRHQMSPAQYRNLHKSSEF